MRDGNTVHVRTVSKKFVHTFRALSFRNYRLFFSGQGISLIGTWMQQVAISWYIYRLTGSAVLLGTVIFFSQIPAVLVGPFAGVIADRFDKRSLLYFTQLASMIQALILAALTISGHGSVTTLLVLSFIIGIINGLDAPVRQSFVVKLVDGRDNLSNAIALNSAMFNSARIIGPSIGGFLISLVGESGCFLINGISYIAVIAALYKMNMPYERRSHPSERKGLITDFKLGIKYAHQMVPIRYMLFLLAVISFTGLSYMTLLPVFAKTVLHGGADIYGILMGSGGAGALTGALYLASRKDVRGLINITNITSVGMSISLMLFPLIHSLYPACILIACIGFCMILLMGACNTVLQTLVDEHMRGRVMSLYTMSFMGFTPFGSLLMGWLSEHIGPQKSVMAGGICCLAASIFFISQYKKIRTHIRPIYIKLGIIPVIEE